MKTSVEEITYNGTDGKYWSKILSAKGVNLFVNVDVITNEVNYSVLVKTNEQFFNTLKDAVDCYNAYFEN